MGFWNWLGWKVSNRMNVVALDVEFELKSSSGETLRTVTKSFIKNNGYLVYDYGEDWELKQKLRKIHKSEFNKVAKELLIQYRKKGISEYNRGVVVKGKHFITCDWSIEIDRKPLTYEEWLQL